MSKHLIWSSDPYYSSDENDKSLSDVEMIKKYWRDYIEEEIMSKDTAFIAAENARIEKAWNEKINADPEKYDNMLVKEYKAEYEQFKETYPRTTVDEYIEENESKCHKYIVKLNNSYIEDEQINCSDIQSKGHICIFGDFITWDGSQMVAAIPDDLVNVSACLKKDGYLKCESTNLEYCIENGDFVCYEAHHDSDTGRYKYYFRVFPADMTEEDIEEVFDKVNKTKKFDAVFEATESLAPGICKVYGWDYEPNEYDVIQPEQGNGRK